MLSVTGSNNFVEYQETHLANIFRNRHFHILAVHLLNTLRALDVWRENLGLDLRLDPLLQASLARVDEVVASVGRIVLWELSCGTIFQASVARIGDRFDPLTLGGGCHACGWAWVDRSLCGVGEWKFGRGARSSMKGRPRRCRRPVERERSGACARVRAHDARDCGGVSHAGGSECHKPARLRRLHVFDIATLLHVR